jgi:hypothetical protein
VSTQIYTRFSGCEIAQFFGRYYGSNGLGQRYEDILMQSTGLGTLLVTSQCDENDLK